MKRINCFLNLFNYNNMPTQSINVIIIIQIFLLLNIKPLKVTTQVIKIYLLQNIFNFE